MIYFGVKFQNIREKQNFLKASVDHIKIFQESEWQWISQQHHLKQENEVISLILQKTTNSGREFHTQPKLI